MLSKENRLSHEIFKLTVSNVSAQLLPFFATPVLSRLFLPQAFALKAFITYANNLFDLIFRFSISIPVFKNEEEAYKTWCLTVTASFIFSVIIGIIIFISPRFVLDMLSTDLYYFSHWVIPLPFCGALIQANTFWLLRKKKFIHVGLITVSRTFFYVLLALLLGFLGYTNNFLLLKIFVISIIIAGIFSSFLFFNDFRSIHLKSFSYPNLLNAIRINNKYIKNGPFFSILENLASLLPLLLIAKIYSLEKSGIFSMVTYLFLAPSAVISTSINQVLLGSVQRYTNDYELKAAIKKLFLVISSAALVGLIATVTMAPHLLPYFLGERWRATGSAAQILIFPFALRFVTNSLSSLIITLGYIKLIARWQLFYFFTMLLLIFFSYEGYSFESFLIIYSIIDFFAYIVQGFIILRVLSLPTLLKNNA